MVELLLKAGAKMNCEYNIYVSKPTLNLVYIFIKLIANPGVFGYYRM